MPDRAPPPPVPLVHEVRQPRRHLRDVVGGIGGQHPERLRHVLCQPGIGGELHPVGDLVQAHPQPEVGGRDPQLTLDGDDVRIHQQQTSRFRGSANGSYWPRMPEEMNASTAPVCAPVTRPVRALAGVWVPPVITRIESEAARDPALAVDDARVGTGASAPIRVTSRTGPRP